MTKTTLDEKLKTGYNKEIMNVYYELYFSELEKLIKQYENEINIKTDLKLGMQAHAIPQFEQLDGSYTFDFILYLFIKLKIRNSEQMNSKKVAFIK